MPEDIPRGRFVWYELMTTNPVAAKAYYTALMGWGTTDWEGGDQPYAMWTRGDTPMGGIMQLPEEAVQGGAPPHWLAYVSTPDVDDTVAAATKRGAKVMVDPMSIPTVGRMAVLADPQGAVFAVYTPEGDTPGHDGPPAIGEFSWHELATTDPEAAWVFYEALFGWEKTDAMDMGPAGTYQMYGRGGMPLGGMFRQPEDMTGPPAWLFYTRVEDVHRLVGKVADLGGQVTKGPMEVPGGSHVAQCVDPQGAMFALHSTASE